MKLKGTHSGKVALYLAVSRTYLSKSSSSHTECKLVNLSKSPSSANHTQWCDFLDLRSVKEDLDIVPTAVAASKVHGLVQVPEIMHQEA